MTVCRMENKKNNFRCIGERWCVSGFTYKDSYDTTVRKAAAPLLINSCDYSKCCLVISGGLVLNLPQQNGDSWTLGRFIYEVGGRRPRNIGIYIPEEENASYKH